MGELATYYSGRTCVQLWGMESRQLINVCSVCACMYETFCGSRLTIQFSLVCLFVLSYYFSFFSPSPPLLLSLPPVLLSLPPCLLSSFLSLPTSFSSSLLPSLPLVPRCITRRKYPAVMCSRHIESSKSGTQSKIPDCIPYHITFKFECRLTQSHNHAPIIAPLALQSSSLSPSLPSSLLPPSLPPLLLPPLSRRHVRTTTTYYSTRAAPVLSLLWEGKNTT